MLIWTRILLVALTGLGIASAASAVPINGDFETDIAPGVVDGWQTLLTPGGTETVDQVSIQPLGGSLHVEASFTSNSGATTFAGIRQDVAATPGTEYSFELYIRLPDGEALQPNAPTYTGTSIVMNLTFFNTFGGTVASDYLFLTSEVTDVYQAFAITLLAPTGTTTAQLQAFLQGGGLGGIEQTAWFDDASFTAVPEPSTALLLALGLVALARRR